ncbi:MAG: metallophosphoesterase family protein [Chloroflexota bacterium]
MEKGLGDEAKPQKIFFLKTIEDTKRSDVKVHKAIYIIGDIHGCYTTLVEILQEAELVNQELSWIGEEAVLCFMGDYVDRGPQGIDCIDLIMKLQDEAEDAGGAVIALVGNHEVLLMASNLFGVTPSPDDEDSEIVDLGNTFVRSWIRNGGVWSDLEQLTERHVEWLKNLPAVVLIDDHLLIHADAMLYSTYGDSIEEINESFYEMFNGSSQRIWMRLLNEFSERYAFYSETPEGKERVVELLERLGGRDLFHGHTPIAHVLEQTPETIVEPLIYADDLCINLDGGICHGGPGFIYQLSSTSSEITIRY